MANLKNGKKEDMIMRSNNRMGPKKQIHFS